MPTDCRVEANDGSGLSYANRVSADGIVRALWVADASPWGQPCATPWPDGGQGTLEDRLNDVRLRAKTGTLIDISALSGWVWLEREDAWAQFSILSKGISKTASIHIENAIVRVVSANAAGHATRSNTGTGPTIGRFAVSRTDARSAIHPTSTLLVRRTCGRARSTPIPRASTPVKPRTPELDLTLEEARPRPDACRLLQPR